ncbi:MAG: HU family DNA-binding protein [candidate division WOR-3 bacterium]
MTITRNDFVETVEKEIKDIYPHISRKEIERILEIFLEEFRKNLVRGHRIELRGFGVFSTKMRKSKVARNPKTNTEMRLPPRRVAVFKPSKVLKNLLSKGG